MADTQQSSDTRAAALLSAAGNPLRLTLLRFLLDDEHCVSQCMEHTGRQQSLVSKHLNHLVTAGLVARRRAGRRQYHRVTAPDLVRDLLDTAERLSRQLERTDPDVVTDQHGS